nr:hypothetical protein [Tanacetum cinerariifolium]
MVFPLTGLGDPEEEPKDDDDDMEMDDEAEVIDPYMDDGSNNPPPLNSADEETPSTSSVIPDADGKIEKFMSERIVTEGRIKKKFKEQDRHFLGLGCDNIKMDRTVRNVMSDLSGLKKLVKGLSDRFDEDAAIADAAIATSGIDDDDDDTAPMDSHPHEPSGSPHDTQTMPPRKSTRGNPPPPLTQDTVNRMIQESVEATIRAERERVQNESNCAEVARECTFADFMKCSPITFRGNEGAVGLIRWIEKTKMVFTVSKCIEADKVVFAAATFQDRALTWCNSQEIQRMEGELWNLRVKEMDISSYTTRFNELVILCPGMVPTKRKKVEAYISGLSKNIKGEVTSSEPATLSKAVRMAHTLMEQKVKAKAEREANNKKR